jgi:hypothetical protein
MRAAEGVFQVGYLLGEALHVEQSIKRPAERI